MGVAVRDGGAGTGKLLFFFTMLQVNVMSSHSWESLVDQIWRWVDQVKRPLY